MIGNESGDEIGDEIFIVDDDPSARAFFSYLFSQAGYRVAAFADAASFLQVARSRTPAAIILDVFLPRSSGLDVLKELDARHYGAPIIMASGRTDIPTVVEAIRRGAVDFIEKQNAAASIVERVGKAIQARSGGRPEGRAGAQPRSFPGRDRLTPRESVVLDLIASGASNQQTANELGISRRTVEVHRARIVAKLNAKNAADLVRIVLSEQSGAAAELR